MKNGMPKIIFNQIKDDDFTIKYAANLAIKSYNILVEQIKKSCSNETELNSKKMLLSPEIISTMMQIAYNENHAINNNKSIILKTVRRDDYYNKYIKRDDCTLYEGDIEEEL